VIWPKVEVYWSQQCVQISTSPLNEALTSAKTRDPDESSLPFSTLLNSCTQPINNLTINFLNIKKLILVEIEINLLVLQSQDKIKRKDQH
jgi:hypothetical protein